MMTGVTAAGGELTHEGRQVSALFKRLSIVGAPLQCASSVLSVVCP